MDVELEVEEQRVNGHDKEREVTTDLPRLIRVRWEQGNTRVLMPEVISRIEGFCREYDQKTDPDKFARSVWAHFCQDKRNEKGEPIESDVFIMVGYRCGVIGHLLATMEEWFGRKSVLLIQYSVDEESEINIELLKLGLAIVEDWGRKQGASEMKVFVRDDRVEKDKEIVGAVERNFRTFYGFKRHRIEMEKDL